ncbi:hypothetical protein AZE42_08506 [Rhizopogon vesiculosus]|uniref:C2H2-type domain-containing protein n=1 Tax=Rhizopogon vesiculosus TaxID=180088 RepID=A0A1J8Q8A1_9AGAM|nr:hypothetical protein AZE42_08506 [Rhizopogon vesiculosus]
MVRQTKQTPEERKESHKRKTPQKKKVTESGVWPCKMDGCNKQFAREADLKRHQRTTKLHTVPGYACPQCDATFTRVCTPFITFIVATNHGTRRLMHYGGIRSRGMVIYIEYQPICLIECIYRHNGVVIEPTEGEKKKGSVETEPQVSGSKSKSRSLSPSSKDKEDPFPPTAPPTAPTPGGLGGPQGPHSYYRQHTMPTGAYMSPPLGVIVEGQYPHSVGLPTSSARLHQATWPPGAWIPEGSPPMPPMGYPHPAYYSYYRGMPHPPPPPEVMAHMQNGVQPHSPSPCDDSSRTGSPTMASMHSGGGPFMSHPSSASGATENFQGNEARSPVIDPSLDLSPTSATSTNQDEETASLDVTQAAVEVALKSAEKESSSAAPDSPGLMYARSTSHSPSAGGSIDERNDVSAAGHDMEPSDSVFFPSRSPPHTHSFERPPEMEHMLTEDGEPMLNPGLLDPFILSNVDAHVSICKAELLTQVGNAMTAPVPNVYDLMLDILNQESLASPPPSL